MRPMTKVKIGDRVTRYLGGAEGVKMPMRVISVESGIITCNAIEEDGSQFPCEWTFDENSGVEEDADLGWGVKYGATGSFIRAEEQ